VLARRWYAIRYERSHLLVRFQLYRPSEQWKLTGFIIEKDVNRAFGDTPLEPPDKEDASAATAAQPQAAENTTSRRDG
jgi:hypothetical protein